MISLQHVQERYTATVESIDKLNAQTICIQLSCPGFSHYRAGQYLKVFRAGEANSYSLASSPSIDEGLHLHIRNSAAGSAGHWFHQQLAVGDDLDISAPLGACFYPAEDIGQPILLISTGCGLAPHYSMVRSALAHGHRGPIRLYHGVRNLEEFYLVDQLKALGRAHQNFHYFPCISQQRVAGYLAGRSLDLALRDTALSADWRIYVSGHPDMVFAARESLVKAGAASSAIYSDFFDTPAPLSCAA
jgi:ferredoxin-NADP reductase